MAKDSLGGRLVLIIKPMLPRIVQKEGLDYIAHVAKDSLGGRLVLIIKPMLPRIVQKEG